MQRRFLTTVVLIALTHAAFFIAYQRPDWDVAWSDQGGYKQLGAAMARSGEFTRFPESPVFIPEVIRTPGYPAFVAVVYRLFGEHTLPVAIAQAIVFALICLIVYAIAGRIAGERTARLAAIMTALFPPLPYYGALVLTEVWTTYVLMAAMLVGVRAIQRGRTQDFLIAGALFSCATLVRPAFILLPFGLAVAMPLLVPAQRNRRRVGQWAAFAAVAALVMVPWFAYNYVYLGRLTLSPAGGIGRGLWEGSWQGRWPGGLHDELTQTAGQDISSDELDARVRTIANNAGRAPDGMLTYVHEWRDIRKIWDEPTDPMERARARVIADQEYFRAAMAHIRADVAGWVMRRMTYGTFILWASDIPIRYTDIDATPTLVIRVIWLLQVVLLATAMAGIVVLVKRRQYSEAALLTLPLLYVTGVHVPLLCETRQSLPVKPLILVLAAIAISLRNTAATLVQTR
ncbi:MAG TPA: glycosyltransferase family 39 protein [Vicinamibacterales bacterium]|nr:glycosyltransferase family 39 protein [Vicinamibacterales bacterium]